MKPYLAAKKPAFRRQTAKDQTAGVVALINARSLTRHSILQILSRALPGCPIVALSSRKELQDFLKESDLKPSALRFNVNTKAVSDVWVQSALELLAFAALKLVQADGALVPTHLSGDALGQPEIGATGTSPGRGALGTALDLTPRELAVLDLVRKAKPNKVIAALLNMQEGTVKVHVRNIFKKLGVANRTEAALAADRLFNQSSAESEHAARSECEVDA